MAMRYSGFAYLNGAPVPEGELDQRLAEQDAEWEIRIVQIAAARRARLIEVLDPYRSELGDTSLNELADALLDANWDDG